MSEPTDHDLAEIVSDGVLTVTGPIPVASYGTTVKINGRWYHVNVERSMCPHGQAAPRSTDGETCNGCGRWLRIPETM